MRGPRRARRESRRLGETRDENNWREEPHRGPRDRRRARKIDAAMPPLFELIASGKIKVDQVLIELHHTKVGRRLRGDFGRTLQRFFAAADRAKLRITHKERNQWGCDGYRCVEYALVSEAFLREANGAVVCATEAA